MTTNYHRLNAPYPRTYESRSSSSEGESWSDSRDQILGDQARSRRAAQNGESSRSNSGSGYSATLPVTVQESGAEKRGLFDVGGPDNHSGRWRQGEGRQSSSTGRNYAPPPLEKAYLNMPEPDDYLHDPKADNDKVLIWSSRGIPNVLALILLALALLMLFGGYPTIYAIKQMQSQNNTFGRFGLGGTNGTGQVPILNRFLNLIDVDTPANARTWTSDTGERFNLVFSDEFETEGRTFWPGDDPYFEAVDIWYGATGDYEWLSPENANTTGGALQLTLSNIPSHNLNFQSAQIQSWNKFCFQGGYIEFNVQLPGTQREQGWWPGLWTMGNLARPGYLGSTDGMWPYSYQGCDSGILLNQTAPGRPGHQSIVTTDSYDKVGLSWLNGMRTPACTCPGGDHPGPNVNVGRSAPELDILEAENVDGMYGRTSQSLQTAPFDPQYAWDNTSADIYDTRYATQFNRYTGGVYQEAVSSLTRIPPDAYSQAPTPRYVRFGVEYAPDFDYNGRGMVKWYMDGRPTWGFDSSAIPARPEIDISRRIIPVEPMSIIMNLHLSAGFQRIDFNSLTFPAVMKIDYVRVYQPASYREPKVSCDPPDHPTADYIKRHLEVYTNPNHTVWPFDVPKNRITGC